MEINNVQGWKTYRGGRHAGMEPCRVGDIQGQRHTGALPLTPLKGLRLLKIPKKGRVLSIEKSIRYIRKPSQKPSPGEKVAGAA